MVQAPPPPSILAPGGAISEVLPGYEYRTEQARVCHAIETALQSKRHCLVEAGTGVGKSLAYLIPAVLAAAAGKKTVISTHTINLQTQLIQRDIPRVMELFHVLMPKLEIKPVLMKGRGNYLCLQDLDAAEEDLFKVHDPFFRKIKSWSKKTRTGDMADLPFTYPEWYDVAANIDTCRSKDCRYYDRCFYFKMRWSALNANLIVVNHALFLSDLLLRTGSDALPVIPAYDYVIFDEAHHLEEVATKVFGLEVSSRQIPRLLDKLARTRGLEIDESRIKALEMMNDELFGMFQSERSDFFFHDVLDDSAEREARTTAGRIGIGLEGVQNQVNDQAKEADTPLKDRLEGLSNQGARLRAEIEMLFSQQGPDHIRWGEKVTMRRSQRKGGQQALHLHNTPIEVGSMLTDLLWNSVSTVVLTSATLSNSGGFSYLRSRLAVPDDAVECIQGSPFDFKNQALLYVPAEHPSPKAVPEEILADSSVLEIRRLLELSEGRAFLLFTSRKMLNAVYDRLNGTIPYPLFRQGDQPPAALLDAFRESGSGCLFGTQTFWEGVDVQGEALSCVIIDRLPFAVPDSPITRARTNAIKAAGGDWFREFSVPQAQIRLKQGFGRLIRTKEDRGIVCILDSRLLTHSYGAEFVRYLPPASRASKWSRVERFWKGEN